jgi:hypothetical protein
MLWAAQPALAYYDRGPVGISTGAASVNVQAGSSVSVSVSLSPAQDGQTQGCGMAECPQTCPSECTDANGQCICAGAAYSTYYADVAVTSSNGGVATASYAGGAVQIHGVGAGSATVTLTASLRQFSTSTATIAVVVSAPAPSGPAGTPSGGPSTNSTSTDSTSTTGTSTGGTSTGGPGGAAGAVASPTGLAQAAEGAGGQEGAPPEEAVVEMHGVSAHLVPVKAPADTVAKLKEIAGSTAQATFWHGGSVERPDYSWTFHGRDLDAAALDALDGLDLTIGVSEKGEGLVAALLKGTGRTLVLDFAFAGALPAPATVYLASPASIPAGDALALYRYDEQGNAFVHVLDGLAAESGYIAFEIDHCSIWAVSAEDLSALSGAAAPAAQAGAAPGGAAQGLPAGPLPAVAGALAVLVALAACARLIASRRRKALEAALSAPAACGPPSDGDVPQPHQGLGPAVPRATPGQPEDAPAGRADATG